MAPPPVWLINGASRGIGQEHARQAAQAGCTVLAACRTPSKATELQQLAKEHPGHVHLLTLDVTDEKSVEGAAAEAAKLCPHGIDVLINNAGYAGPFTLASQTEAEDYLEVLKVNAVGPLLVTKHFLPLLRKSSVRPKIVNISSSMGSLTKNREHRKEPMYSMGVPYQSSKSCLNMQTAIISNELQDMTVISMCPGFVATDMNAFMREDKEVDAKAMRPPVSVKQQRKVIEELKPEDSGLFFGHQGEKYPWTPSKATELQQLAKEHPGQVHLLTLDVIDEKSIEAAAAEAAKLCPHGIDVLINNAGAAGPFTPASQTEAEDYLEVLRVNAVGPMLVTKHFLPLLRKSSVRPKIVNISSSMGSLTKNQEHKKEPMYSTALPYQSSKPCLNMQTAIFSNELQDMTVICMCPGFVATDINAFMRKDKEVDALAMRPPVSVKQQRKVIEELKPEDSGLFFGHQGEKYPW